MRAEPRGGDNPMAMQSNLEIGFALDRRFHWMRGEMEESKKPALLLLGRVLAEAGTRYAIIGGVALQVHQREPRTTLDVDLAVASLAELPRAALRAAGFSEGGAFAHSENWHGPDRTPVQFTDDAALGPAVERAAEIELDGVRLRVIGKADLLREKLRAGRDPARRRSKRLQDLADAEALLEQEPALAAGLSADERAALDALPR